MWKHFEKLKGKRMVVRSNNRLFIATIVGNGRAYFMRDAEEIIDTREVMPQIRKYDSDIVLGIDTLAFYRGKMYHPTYGILK